MTRLIEKVKAVEFLMRSGLMPYLAVVQLIATIGLAVLVLQSRT